MRELRTIEGPQTPTPDDVAYMEYLDELVETPSHSYGQLLFQADPPAFRMGCDEWLLRNRP